MKIFCKRGGFVFNTVHNIMHDVPPKISLKPTCKSMLFCLRTYNRLCVIPQMTVFLSEVDVPVP